MRLQRPLLSDQGTTAVVSLRALSSHWPPAVTWSKQNHGGRSGCPLGRGADFEAFEGFAGLQLLSLSPAERLRERRGQLTEAGLLRELSDHKSTLADK